MAPGKTNREVEFGDFQTPSALADRVCLLLAQLGTKPFTIIEPTCGRGSFLVAGGKRFPAASITGVEVNPEHAQEARRACAANAIDAQVVEANFFSASWLSILREQRDPLLILGNPPWVTNAGVSAVGGSNVPEKRNFQKHAGLDAMTGKGNFDISEWMLLQMLDWVEGRKATVAMLCKTAVARKVLSYAWKHNRAIQRARIYEIDAQTEFNAAVPACLLVCDFSPARTRTKSAEVRRELSMDAPFTTFGFDEGKLIADMEKYGRWRHLQAFKPSGWRSGIKHDCSSVMELRRVESGLVNGVGEEVDIEETCLFPMLKSSDIANEDVRPQQRWMIVPQRIIGEDTTHLAQLAPKTWHYLETHSERLDNRGSSIYRGRPRFSIFGVGDYSFAPWKVAISGFYKRLSFRLVGPREGKPVVVDDTAYFLPFQSEDEAQEAVALLRSRPAQEFFESFVFWDAKRPITVELLNRLDLHALAGPVGSAVRTRRPRQAVLL